MRKFTFLLLMMLVALVPAYAQNRGKDRRAMRKEIHEFKLKFLAQEMDLREDQQKRFFELYNQMSEEKGKLFERTRALEKKLCDSSKASDAEYKAVSDAITATKEKDAEIEKKYDEKFSHFLSQKQIFKMKEAEGRFRDKMHEMRHKNKKRNRK